MDLIAADLSDTARLGVAMLFAVIAVLAVLGLVRWLGGRRWTALRRYRPTSGRLDRLAVVQAGPKTWGVEVAVIYRVDGDRFVCRHRLPARERYPTEAAAWSALGDLAEGATVALWYDPQNPAVSCVSRDRPEPGPLYQLALWLLLGMIILGALAALLT